MPRDRLTGENHPLFRDSQHGNHFFFPRGVVSEQLFPYFDETTNI